MRQASGKTGRKCVNCEGYDPSGEQGQRCRMLNGWSGPSFEKAIGDCGCVHYREARLNAAGK